MASAPPSTVDQTTLARLVEAGAVRSASVIGQPAGWGVVIKYGRVERSLAAKRGQVRLFRRLETVVSYLKHVGIARFDVDTGAFDPAKLRTTRNRPDTATAMKRAHAAVAHDKWFREQVRLGLEDLKVGRTVSDEEHSSRWKKRRATLLKGARTGG
jgi:hypothetical protein